MPIHGLTTQRRLPRLGKIRTGTKVVHQNGREYPRAVDHFVCPPEVQEVYGPEPKALDVILPIDSEELVASAWYKAYTGSRGLVCKGDGLNANRLIDASKKEAEPGTGVLTGPIAGRDAKETEWTLGIVCPGRECEYYGSKQCREVMSLQFLLPTVPGLGVWQLDTGSYHSIINIYSGLELIRGIFGTVAMIPLTLSLEPMEVAPGGQKKTVYVLHLRNKGTLAEIAAQQSRPLIASLMPAPDEGREELLFPEGGHEPGASAPTEEDIAPESKPSKSQGPVKGPRVTGRCERHDRPWAKAPGGRVGHPVRGSDWCWRDELDDADNNPPADEQPDTTEPDTAWERLQLEQGVVEQTEEDTDDDE